MGGDGVGGVCGGGGRGGGEGGIRFGLFERVSVGSDGGEVIHDGFSDRGEYLVERYRIVNFIRIL